MCGSLHAEFFLKLQYPNNIALRYFKILSPKNIKVSKELLLKQKLSKVSGNLAFTTSLVEYINSGLLFLSFSM